METESKSVTILHGAVIITMDDNSRVFRDGGIVIERHRIKAIGQSSHILHQFSAIATQIIDLHGHMLLPGQIQYLTNQLVFFVSVKKTSQLLNRLGKIVCKDYH